MNNISKYAWTIVPAAVIVMFAAIVLWYGNTEVAFKVQGDTLYRQIKNGRIGADCYDENGAKIIAPSRMTGPEWTPIASLGEISKDGKMYSVTCYPYASVSNVLPISTTVRLAGTR